ncbi:polyamine transporter tpo5 [Hypoxylon texense]
MLSALRRASDEVATPSPPQGIVVTDTNLNPVLQMVTWLLLAMTALMLCFRFLTKFFLKTNQRFGWEEVLITSAFLAGLGESVTLLVPGGDIWGKTRSDISDEELATGLKVQFAGGLLYILALALAKLSVCAGLSALSPDTGHRRMTSVFVTAVILWALVAFFGTAFQCGSHGPWEARDDVKCIDWRAYLEFVDITNIITDAALIALPVVVVYPLKMSLRTRITVLSFFSVRAIAATICQLVYLPRLFETDFTLRGFPYYLSMQFVQFASISAACAAYFWPFLRSLRSGLISADNRAFTSQYALSKLRGSARNDTSGELVSGGSSKNRDRSNYIKITTDNTVITTTRGQESALGEPLGSEGYMKDW